MAATSREVVVAVAAVMLQIYDREDNTGRGPPYLFFLLRTVKA